MRRFKLLLCLAITYLASTLGAYAQSVDGIVVAPFAVGNGFATALLQINLPSFFNGSSQYQGGIDLGPGTAPTAVSFGAKGTIFSRKSILGYQYSSNTVDYTTTVPVFVFTALTNSNNVRTGSTGLQFGNFSPPSSVNFEYSPLSLTTGLAVPDFANGPYLVITDDGGTRYLPVTSATVASNFSINQFNGLNQLGAKASAPTNTDAPILNNAFISVRFNAAQLGVRGTVTNLGLVTFRQGLTLVHNIGVNNTPATAVVVDSSNTYPF
ncbi:MAG: hypothetical protein JST89_08710 [Cyanobacteria bacterium SZAS-4]|nr:hypothetical protein [Cyanobacteria bacterium SZAS-4]